MSDGADPLLTVADALLAAARTDDYAGYDPFDGLNSVLLQRSGLDRFALARLAWIQLFKRSPVNFRTLAGVPKRRNPKGVALFVLGMLEDYDRTGNRALLDEAARLCDWLLAERCNPAAWPHHCWGYHFDWQAKAFYVPVGKPNVITTWYVAQALLKLALRGGVERYRDAALDSAKFVAGSLYTEADGYQYFAYIPGERAFVHNASLWGAALVVLASEAAGDNAMRELGLRVARQSVAMQDPNGAWRYGTLAHHQFIDGFHTGYNLEALDLMAKTLGTAEFDLSIARGMTYYRDQFFEADGTAKYYHNNRYPLDMHSVAQAVITFLRVGPQPFDAPLADKVLRKALASMYMGGENRFYYQVTRWWKNSIDYTRWTQAWSYYALAMANRHRAAGGLSPSAPAGGT